MTMPSDGLAATARQRLLTGSLLGGVASADLLVRTVPDALGFVGSLAVPVTMLSLNFVLDAGLLGWVLNWLLFFLVAVQLAPYLFPTRSLEWSRGLPVRLSIAVAAVAVATLVESALSLLAFGPADSPLSFDVVLVAGVVGLTYLVVLVATFVPPVRGDLPLFETAQDALVVLPESHRESMGEFEFSLRATLVATMLGVLFAGVNLLFPIPELFVIGVVAYDAVLVLSSLGCDDRPSREDIEESVARGAVAAWAGLRELWTLVFVTAGLFFWLLYAFALGARWQDWLSAGLQPRLFVLSGLGIALVAIALYWVRIFERLPNDAFEGTIVERRSRVPGFLVAPGALLGLVYGVVEYYGTPTAPGVAVWAALVGLAALSVGSVVLADRVPYLVERDHHAIPIAMGALIGVGTAVQEVTMQTALLAQPLAFTISVDGLVAGGFVIALFTVPYFEPELLRAGPSWVSARGVARWWGGVFLGLPLAAVAITLYPEGSLVYRATLYPWGVWVLLTVVVTVLATPALFALGLSWTRRAIAHLIARLTAMVRAVRGEAYNVTDDLPEQD